MPALARAVSGRARVARTLVAWVRAGAHLGGLAIRPASVNGQPGAVLADEAGRPAAVWALDVAGRRIRG